MKISIILPLLLCAVHANPTDKQEAKTKTTSSAVNTISHESQTPKYETIYQPIKYQQQQVRHELQSVQQKPQLIPVQIVPKPYYVPHNQPQAMIIIAQPAYVPQSLLYANPMQQLLNYFHNNPQAKYQFLHGNYQQPAQAQPTYIQPVVASPNAGNYVVTPQVQPQYTHQQYQQQTQPQYEQPAQPQYQQQALTQYHQQQQQYQQPAQLGSIAQLAQLSAQQYVSTQMKSAPAIVTGFEQFTPEQQAQIKAQLSSHLGSGFHAVSTPNQYSAKYVAEGENPNTSNFVPSPQLKNEQVGAQAGDIVKTRYVKPKH